jgi:hypothetical protein
VSAVELTTEERESLPAWREIFSEALVGNGALDANIIRLVRAARAPLYAELETAQQDLEEARELAKELRFAPGES